MLSEAGTGGLVLQTNNAIFVGPTQVAAAPSCCRRPGQQHRHGQFRHALGGSGGSVVGVVTANNATVNPGLADYSVTPNNKGTETTNTSLDFKHGGNLILQLSYYVTPGTDYDRYIVTGTLTLGGARRSRSTWLASTWPALSARPSPPRRTPPPRLGRP